MHREQFNEVPPHVEYSLTDMGKDLLPVFYAIMNWGFKYEKEIYTEVFVKKKTKIFLTKDFCLL